MIARVVERSATVVIWLDFVDSTDGASNKRPCQRPRTNAMEVLHHLAKVRVAGSNPVVRSRCAGWIGISGTRRAPDFASLSMACPWTITLFLGRCWLPVERSEHISVIIA